MDKMEREIFRMHFWTFVDKRSSTNNKIKEC